MRPATNVFHAVRFARAEGRPLTLFATLAWHRLGLDSGQGKELFRRLRAKVRRQWTYRRGTLGHDLGSFDDVGAHEAPRDLANTHWMIRVPPKQRAFFEQSVATFLQKLLPGADLDGVLHFERIEAAGELAKYILKGVDPSFAPYFHMDAVDQGFVSGRGRTFVSRSLGFGARKDAGWKRKAQAMPGQGRKQRQRPALGSGEAHGPSLH